jgi:hypothetical protein
MSWGPWQYKGCPEIGDWVKVDCEFEDTSRRRIFEGMVIEITEDWIVEICPRPYDDHKYIATRWAKKALAEGVEVTRKALVDA